MRGVHLIVAGVEDSNHGEAAARAAARYAAELGADLHLVHVVDLPKAVYTMFETIDIGTDQLAALERAAVWKRMGPVLEALGVTARCVDLEGVPSEEVVRYAEEHGADLIVVGTHRRGELRRLFLGSTSMRIIQLAHCDVLIAAPGD